MSPIISCVAVVSLPDNFIDDDDDDDEDAVVDAQSLRAASPSPASEGSHNGRSFSFHFEAKLSPHCIFTIAFTISFVHIQLCVYMIA